MSAAERLNSTAVDTGNNKDPNLNKNVDRLTKAKKAIRDSKDKKECRKETASNHYKYKAQHNFISSTPSQLKVKLTLDEAVAIAVPHDAYCKSFLAIFSAATYLDTNSVIVCFRSYVILYK